MRIHVFNKQTNKIITFVSANSFKSRPSCSWNELTPEQELEFAQFVIISTLGFDTFQTPETNLFQQWNFNGKKLSSTYWGTRLLTISFVNQAYKKSSTENVASLLYETLRHDDDELSMTIVDDFGSVFYCSVVLNKPNTNETEDSVIFTMLDDKFTTILLTGASQHIGGNTLLNGQTNNNASLQLPLCIKNPKNKRSELEFDRDHSNYFDVKQTSVFSLANVVDCYFFQFVNADGSVCTVNTGVVKAGTHISFDIAKKSVIIDGITIDTVWIGDINPGRVRIEYSHATTITMCEIKEVGVIAL